MKIIFIKKSELVKWKVTPLVLSVSESQGLQNIASLELGKRNEANAA